MHRDGCRLHSVSRSFPLLKAAHVAMLSRAHPCQRTFVRAGKAGCERQKNLGLDVERQRTRLPEVAHRGSEQAQRSSQHAVGAPAAFATPDTPFTHYDAAQAWCS